MLVAYHELKPELETAFPPTTRGSHEGTKARKDAKGARPLLAQIVSTSCNAPRPATLETTNSSGELRDDDHASQQ